MWFCSQDCQLIGWLTPTWLAGALPSLKSLFLDNHQNTITARTSLMNGSVSEHSALNRSVEFSCHSEVMLPPDCPWGSMRLKHCRMLYWEWLSPAGQPSLRSDSREQLYRLLAAFWGHHPQRFPPQASFCLLGLLENILSPISKKTHLLSPPSLFPWPLASFHLFVFRTQPALVAFSIFLSFLVH